MLLDSMDFRVATPRELDMDPDCVYTSQAGQSQSGKIICPYIRRPAKEFIDPGDRVKIRGLRFPGDEIFFFL